MTQFTQRQTQVLAELKAKYVNFAKDGQDYRPSGYSFLLTKATVPYVDSDGYEYSESRFIQFDELRELAKICPYITFVENTQIAMYANEHILIHSGILEFGTTDLIESDSTETSIEDTMTTQMTVAGLIELLQEYDGSDEVVFVTQQGYEMVGYFQAVAHYSELADFAMVERDEYDDSDEIEAKNQIVIAIDNNRDYADEAQCRIYDFV